MQKESYEKQNHQEVLPKKGQERRFLVLKSLQVFFAASVFGLCKPNQIENAIIPEEIMGEMKFKNFIEWMNRLKKNTAINEPTDDDDHNYYFRSNQQLIIDNLKKIKTIADKQSYSVLKKAPLFYWSPEIRKSTVMYFAKKGYFIDLYYNFENENLFTQSQLIKTNYSHYAGITELLGEEINQDVSILHIFYSYSKGYIMGANFEEISVINKKDVQKFLIKLEKTKKTINSNYELPTSDELTKYIEANELISGKLRNEIYLDLDYEYISAKYLKRNNITGLELCEFLSDVVSLNTEPKGCITIICILIVSLRKLHNKERLSKDVKEHYLHTLQFMWDLVQEIFEKKDLTQYLQDKLKNLFEKNASLDSELFQKTVLEIMSFINTDDMQIIQSTYMAEGKNMLQAVRESSED